MGIYRNRKVWWYGRKNGRGDKIKDSEKEWRKRKRKLCNGWKEMRKWRSNLWKEELKVEGIDENRWWDYNRRKGRLKKKILGGGVKRVWKVEIICNMIFRGLMF